MEWLGQAASVIGGILTGWLSTLLYEPVRSGVGGFFRELRSRWNEDADDLSGKWEATFEEETKSGKKQSSTETITVEHRKGSERATGIGVLPPAEENRPREFEYRMQLHKDTVYGNFSNKKSVPGAVSGRGVFLLQMSGDRRIMIGQAVWFDTDLDRVAASAFKWRRL